MTGAGRAGHRGTGLTDRELAVEYRLPADRLGQLDPKSIRGSSWSSPGMPSSVLRIRSCVPSVEPVSQTTQWSMRWRTERRHRSITCESFLTTLQRQRLCFFTASMWHGPDVSRPYTREASGRRNPSERTD
ncbi:hypothetical protein ADL01_08220 [Streptomyces sp. NRRL WC-3618]|nr:hypothetical protein ADL01_08220 [Streptomyces sp. NRRL WC-3618]